MNNLQKTIRDLIFFYVKENYHQYLTDHNLDEIPKNNIRGIINKLYTTKKDHLKDFLKSSLIILLKDDYPGDLVILNIIVDIFADDELNQNRLYLEIVTYQENIKKGKNNYKDIYK